MNQIRIKKCMVCEKEYKYNTIRGCKGRRTKSVRMKNSVTCSKKCSRIYGRISAYIHKNYKSIK